MLRSVLLSSNISKKFCRLLNHKAISVENLLDCTKVGNVCEVKGWVKSLRNQKDNIFVDVSDGSSHRKLQILLPKALMPKNLTTGASIIASGHFSSTPKGDVELAATQIEVIGECVISEGYPFAPRKQYDAEYIRQYLHFRPRTNKFSSLLRIRNAATLAICNYLDSEGFFNLHTPILTSNDCEGAGEIFKVIPNNEELQKSMQKDNGSADDAYFGTKTFLTVSGQLHLEAAVHGLNKVYNLGPIFRAENSKSRLHLSEFYMLEAEVAFLDTIEDLICCIEKLIKSVTGVILHKCKGDMELFNKTTSLNFSWIDKSFPIVTYTEAVNILESNKNCYKDRFDDRRGLTKEHELFLVKHFGGLPLFVINWPKESKPFYMRECEDDHTKVAALDLLAPEVGEVVGGSLRENNYNKLKDKLPHDHCLDWYLELRKFGSVPTGGFGLGFERYLQFILGIPNIKDTIPFPRWPHNCSL